MGKWVHVVSRQEKFGGTEAFNWGSDKFAYALSVCGCVCHNYDEDSYNFDRFECKKSEFKAALANLKRYSKGEDVDGCDKEEISEALKDMDCSAEQVIDVMQHYLKECDKKSDWMIFVAW